MDSVVDLEAGRINAPVSRTSQSQANLATYNADTTQAEKPTPTKTPDLSGRLIDTPSLSCIFATQQEHLLGPAEGVSLSWYTQWLNQRLKRLPQAFANNLGPIGLISREVAECAKKSYSVEDIAARLVSLGLVVASELDYAKEVGRAITFAFLGWQTMLYEAMITETPSVQISIEDVQDGYCGVAFAARTIWNPQFTYALPNLLIGFGLMLPKENFFSGIDDASREAFDNIAVVTPGGMNAAVMTGLAHLNIEWVDCIGPHLELDKATNTVFLYRYPSFCLANISNEDEKGSGGVIHGLAAEDSSTFQWASDREITQLLKEILLSYRLLFAQDATSRRLFRKMKVFDYGHMEAQDPFLAQICNARRPNVAALYPDRESYRLSRDFPVLRERIAIIQQQLLSVKPRGWKAIWGDKRDSVQWWTFWAVIFFGGTGIVLSAMQVILQAIQLFEPR